MSSLLSPAFPGAAAGGSAGVVGEPSGEASLFALLAALAAGVPGHPSADAASAQPASVTDPSSAVPPGPEGGLPAEAAALSVQLALALSFDVSGAPPADEKAKAKPKDSKPDSPDTDAGDALSNAAAPVSATPDLCAAPSAIPDAAQPKPDEAGAPSVAQGRGRSAPPGLPVAAAVSQARPGTPAATGGKSEPENAVAVQPATSAFGPGTEPVIGSAPEAAPTLPPRAQAESVLHRQPDAAEVEPKGVLVSGSHALPRVSTDSTPASDTLPSTERAGNPHVPLTGKLEPPDAIAPPAKAFGRPDEPFERAPPERAMPEQARALALGHDHEAPAAPPLPPPGPPLGLRTDSGPAAPASANAMIPLVQHVPLAAVPVEIGVKALAGANRFEIRLDPPDLGRIDVRLEIDGDGGVKAHLVVDKVDTFALLQRDAKTLENAFEQAGLKPTDGSIDLALRNPEAEQRGQHRSDARDGRADAQPSNRPPPDADEAELPRMVRTIWRASGVDVRI